MKKKKRNPVGDSRVRVFFAGKALQGLLTHGVFTPGKGTELIAPDVVAKLAIEYADLTLIRLHETPDKVQRDPPYSHVNFRSQSSNVSLRCPSARCS